MCQFTVYVCGVEFVGSQQPLLVHFIKCDGQYRWRRWSTNREKKVSFRLAIVWLGCVLERRRVLLSVQSNGTSLHNIRRYLLFLLCSNTRRQCYTAIRDHPNESSLVIKSTFNIWNVWKYQTRMQTNKLKKRWFAAPRGCNVSRVHPTMRNMHSYGTNENHFFFIFHFSIIFMAVPALCATIGQKEREREKQWKI